MKNITLSISATVLLTSLAMVQLPEPGFIFVDKTALVITDPQNDFLSPEDVTWGVVGKSVEENNTVDNIDALFKWAQNNEVMTFVSPHYYYPHDHWWKIEGVLEALMHKTRHV